MFSLLARSTWPPKHHGVVATLEGRTAGGLQHGGRVRLHDPHGFLPGLSKVPCKPLDDLLAEILGALDLPADREQRLPAGAHLVRLVGSQGKFSESCRIFLRLGRARSTLEPALRRRVVDRAI